MKKKLEGLNHLNKKLAIESIRETQTQQSKSSPRNLGYSSRPGDDRNTEMLDYSRSQEQQIVESDDTARFFT